MGGRDIIQANWEVQRAHTFLAIGCYLGFLVYELASAVSLLVNLCCKSDRRTWQNWTLLSIWTSLTAATALFIYGAAGLRGASESSGTRNQKYLAFTVWVFTLTFVYALHDMNQVAAGC